jgi:flagellin FlaB
MVFNKSNQRKGAQGIGTLIIFIALILVAAVAAGVLIQTASSLQSKSLDVGRQSQEKITTDIEVVQVYAADTSDGVINGTSVDTMTMIVRLGSGSSPINLNDLIVKMDTQSGSQNLQYVAGVATAALYNVSYVSNSGVAGTAGYLVTGDLAQVTFLNLNDVSEGETATIRLLTKNGAVKPVDMTTPSAMVEVTTYLFP